MVFHDGYAYLENRFNLKNVGALALNPEVAPGAKRLREIQQKIEKTGSVCLFSEPQFSPEAWAFIAEGPKVTLSSLDLLGVGIEPGPELYFTLINNLADTLADCLGQSG